MNTLRSLSQAWLFLARPILCKGLDRRNGGCPIQSDRQNRTKRLRVGRSLLQLKIKTSATTNAPPRQQACCKTRGRTHRHAVTSNQPRSRSALQPPTRRRSQLDGARVKNGRLTKARLQPTHRDLGNDEDLIGPRILYLGAGRKAAYIDIPFTSKWAEYISRFPGNRFSRRKRRRWCGSARRRDPR
jgi:hypothetical protein